MENINLVSNMADNINTMRQKVRNSSDFVAREVAIKDCKITVLVTEGQISSGLVNDMIIRPIIEYSQDSKPALLPENLFEYIKNDSLIGLEMSEVATLDDVFTLMMSGFAVILIDGVCKGIAIGAQGFAFRSVGEPASEINIKGSREGFTEPVRLNLSMIRRRIKSPELTFEMMKVGKKSKTDICLVYLIDTVDEKILQNVRKKLSRAKLDIVLDSGYLIPFLEGKPLSIFSNVGTTERPDTLCAKVNEGRIGILVDGTPFALIVPFLWSEIFQTVDDYSHRPYYATFIRVIKYIAFFATILLPGVYVGVSLFTPELFPQELLYNIASAQEVTPFPLMIEAFGIHLVFELMREAGLRLPRQVGHAVSIVGALVIGTAAVTSGFIGAPMLMILAITGISSFVIPAIYEPIAILRFVFIILGGTMGLYGIMLGVCILCANITKLNSFGVPYTAPISPFSFNAMRDVFYRASWTTLSKMTAKIQSMNGISLDEKDGDLY